MDKVRVTHVEVRRVQNGFVVMALDYSPDFRSFKPNGARASFVAKDEEEVKTVIGNILTSAEMDWLPTIDLPMIEMQRGVQRAPYEDGAAVHGHGVQMAPSPPPPNMVPGSIKLLRTP